MFVQSIGNKNYLNNGEFITAELELNIAERHKKCGKAKEMNFSSNN